MRCYGKVVEYKDNVGSIIAEDGKELLLLKKNIINCSALISMGDYVSFEEELFDDVEYKRWVAFFVKKIEKK